MELDELSVFGRKEYTAVGYNNCDSTEPVLPFQISCSLAEEHEYIAHGMWIMAEISSRSYLSYLLTIQSVTELSKKELVTADLNGSFVRSRALMADLKRTVQNNR